MVASGRGTVPRPEPLALTGAATANTAACTFSSVEHLLA